jgi:chloramphenicol 3-O phosphotransferase
LPGIGLRPGGERPDLEDLVVGQHEAYSKPLHILRDSARRLAGLGVLWVGVRCPIGVVWQRREESWGQTRDTADEELLAAVERWQHEVHAHGSYDLEVDTSVLTPAQCAEIAPNG